MIKMVYDTKQFRKQLENLVKYSTGFIDGVNAGKTKFLQNLGVSVIESLKEFIDSTARSNEAMLHHVYEWGRVGSPDARLYDIQYTVSNVGLSIRSTFSQSRSIRSGSTTPFYDKARIMESGVSITIKPKQSEVLAFEAGNDTVFTSSPVTVENPGGSGVAGSFEKTYNIFFSRYFTQAFLRSSGIISYINNPTVYSKNLKSGMNSGKAKGYETGYAWIVNAGVVN